MPGGDMMNSLYLFVLGRLGVWWLLLCLVFTGIGLLARIASGLKHYGTNDLPTSFWVGWALTIGFLQIWHFILPIQPLAWMPIVGLGVLGWVMSSRRSTGARRSRRRRIGGGVFVLVCVGVVGLWIADRATDHVGQFDTGLYQATAVKWNATYALVPGLGNLHGRLAFNSSHWLYAALLDVGPWKERTFHLANGLLLVVLAAASVTSIARLCRGTRRPVRSADIFMAFMLVPILREVLGRNLVSLSPDLPAFALGIVVTRSLLRFAELGEMSRCEERYALMEVVLVSAVGVTVRLSFAAFAVMALIAVAVLWWRRRQRRGTGVPGVSFALWLTGVALVAVWLPWMVRGVVLSGWPFYPVPVGGVPVAWQVPRALAISELCWVRSWARQPGAFWPDVLGSWSWFGPWWRHTLPQVARPLLIALLGYGLAGLVCLLRRRVRRFHAFCFLPAAVSLCTWFWAAPDPRFAGSCFWVLAAGGGVSLLSQLEDTGWPRRATLVLAALFAVLAWNTDRPLWVGPKPSGRQYFSPHHSSYRTKLTQGDVPVNLPKQGGQCWNTPLPAAPYMPHMLRYRRDTDLRGGFLLDPDVTYVDIHGSRVPQAMTLGPGLGASIIRLGGWYPYRRQTRRRWMETPATLLVYAEDAGQARLELTPDAIYAGGGRWGDAGVLKVSLSRHAVGTMALKKDEAAAMRLSLERDFNVIRLSLTAGNGIVDDGSFSGAESNVASVAFSAIALDWITEPSP